MGFPYPTSEFLYIPTLWGIFLICLLKKKIEHSPSFFYTKIYYTSFEKNLLKNVSKDFFGRALFSGRGKVSVIQKLEFVPYIFILLAVDAF